MRNQAQVFDDGLPEMPAPVHRLSFDITAADWCATPESVLDCLMWAASKAAELAELDARMHHGYPIGGKLAGYAEEWHGISESASAEIRNRAALGDQRLAEWIQRP